ncbi:kinase-like domain-containing protein [Phialemonium atrogriseum]|uniref:Kinase-like domain-containing protein n=1 Tax=Phialemonium atrogriseum TaxID=1093897 RepID=A0AAJ0C2J8_9PEZI|nr:kinase-like domain-containing protein [Phialemonium atrogriseum]KAK1768760.1 kinase-like domain-containing protein [Phialemonium atrogriseum]
MAMAMATRDRLRLWKTLGPRNQGLDASTKVFEATTDQMLDQVVELRVHRDRDAFIESIAEADVCRLASSFHDNEPCAVFKPVARGSYNVCFFVHFSHSGDSWVIRVPITPCLARGVGEKLRREVVTMQYVSERTSIPIPRVIAYSFDSGSHVLPPFIILEYIEGRLLSGIRLPALSDDKRTILYEQLADIYAQLRRLEFSAIGQLCHDGSDSSTIHVTGLPPTIDLNIQELEELWPSSVQREYKAPLTSSGQYVSMLLSITQNAFEKSPSSVWQEGRPNVSLLYGPLRRLHQGLLAAPERDDGPFVLTHGDLNPHNLLVDEKGMTIVALLDWEWSRVVPLQLFNPPIWLTGLRPDLVSYSYAYELYTKELDRFRSVLGARDMEMFGGILAAAALENWTAIYFFSHRFIHSCICPDDQINTFMASDPSRQQFVERKVRDWKAYQNECRCCGLHVDSDEESDEEGVNANNENNNNSEKTIKKKGLAATRWT